MAFLPFSFLLRQQFFAFQKAFFKGNVTDDGINDSNDATNHADVMKKVYELGKLLQSEEKYF